MSKTDKTRPYEVQDNDTLTRRIGSDPIVGGLTGKDGNAKQLRGEINTVRRQKSRAACHKALRMLNPEDFDLQPFWGDRNCVVWTLD